MKVSEIKITKKDLLELGFFEKSDDNSRKLKVLKGLKIEINSLLKESPCNKELLKEKKKINKEIQQLEEWR